MFDGDSEGNEVAQIVKHWGGCREIFGGANDFSLRCEYMNHFKLEALISVSVYISTPCLSFSLTHTHQHTHTRTHARADVCMHTNSHSTLSHSLSLSHSPTKSKGYCKLEGIIIGQTAILIIMVTLAFQASIVFICKLMSRSTS